MKTRKVTPLYQKIQNDIADQIATGEIVAEAPLPTRDELAMRYDTTRATVDRAVQELIADGLVVGGSGRRTTVARPNQTHPSLLVTWNEPSQHLDMGDYFFGPIAQGILRASADYEVTAHFRDSQPSSYAATLQETSSRGILMLRPHYDDIPTLQELWRRGIPIVTLPGALKNIPFIASDNVGGVAQAIDHLVALGHRDIGFVSLAVPMPDHLERLQGFLQAMSRHGLSVQPQHIYITDEMPKNEYDEHLLAWLKLPSPPTAVLVADSLMGLSLVRQLKSLGRDVPGDISVVQFDDTPAPFHLTPATTIVKQDVVRLGYAGVELLLRLIRGEETMTVQRLATTLITRDSTAPPSVL